MANRRCLNDLTRHDASLQNPTSNSTTFVSISNPFAAFSPNLLAISLLEGERRKRRKRLQLDMELLRLSILLSGLLNSGSQFSLLFRLVHISSKVLMLGSRNQTIIGRPTLADAAVHAVVEEHELTKLRISDIQEIEKPEKTEVRKPEKTGS
ncbi:hypothetical protein HHK36_001870 [Tetracentron sinense]|uniref:Uncharacterized protein n=1 Tax=Tetracentron sinense TaxID=13715 RepID=A0A834ZUT7_TETSI|nr:hypothetical protein HHK36_001870 [Tetracentron sinense]